MRCLCLAAIVAAALLVIAVGEDYYYYQDEASEDGDVYYYYEDEELAPTHMQQPVDVQASGWTEGHLEDRTEVQLEEDVAYLYSDEEEMDMHGEAFTFGDTAESSASDEADPLPPKYGFKKSGSGLKRMSAPMVSAAFLDDMATQFGCLLSKNSGPQRVQDPSYRPPPKEPVDKNKQTAKKLTAKEVEAARAKAREEEERKFKTMHPLGADCETQVCGACRSVVEVFATAVHAAIRDPRYQFVYDVAEGFCERSVGAKYSPLMIHVCSVMLDVTDEPHAQPHASFTYYVCMYRRIKGTEKVWCGRLNKTSPLTRWRRLRANSPKQSMCVAQIPTQSLYLLPCTRA